MPDKTIALTKELKEFSLAAGADLFGVADLAPVRQVVASQGPPRMAGFPRAVSIGMGLNDEIVDSHSPLETRRDSLYWHHVYSVVTASLDFHAYRVSRWLAGRGFRALPVPGSSPYNQEKLEGIFSHKLAAHLAGLGWIGKSCLLVTPEHGPRVRWATVLTTAPLEPTAKGPTPERCGTCTACVEICPVHAFSGRPFQPEEPREARFDALHCDGYQARLQAKCGIRACGLCLYVCPFGQKAAKNPQ